MVVGVVVVGVVVAPEKSAAVADPFATVVDCWVGIDSRIEIVVATRSLVVWTLREEEAFLAGETVARSSLQRVALPENEEGAKERESGKGKD